jgi:hypothetical protein
MYILMHEPQESGTMLAGAFGALDQVYGSQEFSESQAVDAIISVLGGSAPASSLFNNLVAKGYVSEV